MLQAEQFRTIATDLTGDILGAFEQLAETAILLMAASFFHSGLQL